MKKMASSSAGGSRRNVKSTVQNLCWRPSDGCLLRSGAHEHQLLLVDALIFGADGRLFGVVNSGGSGGGIFSLSTDGTGFAARNVFTDPSNAPSIPAAGLLLARNGVTYGTTQFGLIELSLSQDNGVV